MNLEDEAFIRIPQDERTCCLRMAKGHPTRLPMNYTQLPLVTAHGYAGSFAYLLSAWGRKVAQMEARRIIVDGSGF